MSSRKKLRVSEKSYGGGYPGGGSMFMPQFYGPREPFLTAWQRNMSECDSRDPSLLAFSGIYACTTIISEDIAKLPLNLKKWNSPEKEFAKVAFNHPTHLLYQRPNSYQTTLEFIQLHVAAKLMTGNSYIFKELDKRGVCKAMHVLPPGTMRPVVIENGDASRAVFYQLLRRDQHDLVPTFENTIPAELVIHDRMNTLWHPLIGVSPIFAAAHSAATGARIIMNSETLFSNHARPAGVLTTASEIKPEVAQRLKARWEEAFSGGNFGRTAVLGNGLKWDAVVVNPIDSQLIEQLRWTIEDVARVFRVPIYKLGDLTKSSYRNSEHMARDYYQGCLQYHISATERRFDMSLRIGSDHYTEFDLKALFSMETDTRFKYYQTALNAGVMSINEARMQEGLPPVEGGEEPRVQAQYLPLSKVADVNVPIVGAASGPAMPAQPADAGSDEPAADQDDDEEASVIGADMWTKLLAVNSAAGRLPNFNT